MSWRSAVLLRRLMDDVASQLVGLGLQVRVLVRIINRMKVCTLLFAAI
jgi:hypothetical protein